ncbi:MAG: PilW family protein [Burkholderiaceae bacterium]
MSRRSLCFLAQHGTGLIELLIAAALSLGVVLIAILLLQSANSSFIWLEQSALLQENGRYAIELVGRALRQTALLDISQPIAQRYTVPPDGAVRGADARSVQFSGAGFSLVNAPVINGSDVLVVRFAGAGDSAAGNSAADTYGGVLNCAGFAVPVLKSDSEDLGWSIFYLAASGTGEPELRCAYRGAQQWDTQAIVAGVESFQVLYGVDTDGDGFANRFLNASGVSALDANEATKYSHWTQVVVIRIALLLRSPHSLARESGLSRFELFGSRYAAEHSSDDPGTRIFLHDLPLSSRKRVRLMTQSVIYLRNTLQPTAPCAACKQQDLP